MRVSGEVEHSRIEVIRHRAEHGLPESLMWMASDDLVKFLLYPFYDVPSSAWGIDTIGYRLGQGTRVDNQALDEIEKQAI